MELLGRDAMDLAKDGLLEGVARNDHETTGISFLFCNSVATAVWVGVWRGSEWRVDEEGEGGICRAQGHG